VPRAVAGGEDDDPAGAVHGDVRQRLVELADQCRVHGVQPLGAVQGDPGDALVRLVDLPGYGYAEASKAAVKRWTGLVRRYLQTRAALRRVCLLIDARHGIKEVDQPLLDMLDRAGVSYQIVLTKTDKLGPTALAGNAGRVAAELASRTAAHPEIQLTSAEERRGIAALRATLADLAIAPSDAPVLAASQQRL